MVAGPGCENPAQIRALGPSRRNHGWVSSPDPPVLACKSSQDSALGPSAGESGPVFLWSAAQSCHQMGRLSRQKGGRRYQLTDPLPNAYFFGMMPKNLALNRCNRGPLNIQTDISNSLGQIDELYPDCRRVVSVAIIPPRFRAPPRGRLDLEPWSGQCAPLLPLPSPSSLLFLYAFRPLSFPCTPSFSRTPPAVLARSVHHPIRFRVHSSLKHGVRLHAKLNCGRKRALKAQLTGLFSVNRVTGVAGWLDHGTKSKRPLGGARKRGVDRPCPNPHPGANSTHFPSPSLFVPTPPTSPPSPFVPTPPTSPPRHSSCQLHPFPLPITLSARFVELARQFDSLCCANSAHVGDVALVWAVLSSWHRLRVHNVLRDGTNRW